MAAPTTRPQLRTYSKRVTKDSCKHSGKRKSIEDAVSSSVEDSQVYFPVLKKRIISDYFKPTSLSSSPSSISVSISPPISPLRTPIWSSSSPPSSNCSSVDTTERRANNRPISAAIEGSVEFIPASTECSSIVQSSPRPRQSSSSPSRQDTPSRIIRKKRPPRRLTLKPTLLYLNMDQRNPAHLGFVEARLANSRQNGLVMTLSDAVPRGGLKKKTANNQSDNFISEETLHSLDDDCTGSLGDDQQNNQRGIPISEPRRIAQSIDRSPLTARPRSPLDITTLIRGSYLHTPEPQQSHSAVQDLDFQRYPNPVATSPPSLITEAIRNQPREVEGSKSQYAGRNTNLIQSQLNLGQNSTVHCETCQLTYNESLEDERARHKDHHDNYEYGVSIKNLKFEGKNQWTRHKEDGTFQKVIMVDHGSNRRWKEAVQYLLSDHVDPALGASEIAPETLWSTIPDPVQALHHYDVFDTHMGDVPADRNVYNLHVQRVPRYAAFLLIEKNRTVSCLLAERISTALGYRTELKEKMRASSSDTQASLATDKVRANKSSESLMGVSKIWTHEKHRRCGNAQYLLNLARGQTFIPRQTISKRQVAFTNPTSQGEKFAKTFQGTDEFDWLEYVPEDWRVLPH